MGRSILISGAGSGIGRATAVALATTAPDLNLILLGRRREPLEATRAALPRPEVHRIITASQADVKDLRAALRAADLGASNLIGVIANAGVGGSNRYGDGDRWDEVIATNLSGTYYLINECIPALRAAQSPTKQIVIISSVLARLGVPGYQAYCASKAGLLGLMRSLAATFAAEGILVNAVLPGWVDTDMAREGIKQFAAGAGYSYDKALASQMSVVPTGKMAKPEEVGALIKYLLAADQTSFTGQCFDINNGALMP